MQVVRRNTPLCLALLLSFGVASSIDLSPISRVVQLLQNLGKQVEADSKKEENLFETFICWGQKVVDTKTASNSQAESRIDMLTQYLADIDAGRIEFTSERQDLEKEIEELTGDLELAQNLRNQENKDFKVAEDEMKKAVTALTSAVDVLGKATKNSKGSLLTLKTSVNEGFAQRAAEGASLNQAIEISSKFLTKGDATFLSRLLTGEVPKPDWKKLNRKATFKMKYKARSTKIQSVLKKLLSTFQANLNDAQKKEAASLATYTKLKGTKDGQLEKVQDSLAKMESEMGARGMSKADATKEVSDLKIQVTNDEKFIGDTSASMATKTTEWKARQVLRVGETKAISQAIAILSADDAKDNFKKSQASQGFFFLQTSQQAAVITRAKAEVQKVLHLTNDDRLNALMGTFMEKGHFDEVIKAINKMITNLKADEAADLTNKEDCEKTRMEDIKDAIDGGRDIDDKTDAIATLNGEIKDLNSELDETRAELKAATDEINQAKKIRGEENAEWKVSDEDDKQASETVGNAMTVLEKFYKDNKLMLVQKQPAGEAPVPPPSTWEGDYGGKTGEMTGIIGILKLCQEDIDKDRTSAKADEDKAQAAYDKAFKAFEEQETSLNKAIGSLEGQIGAKQKTEKTTKTNRVTKKGELDATMKKIKDADPGCNYIAVNFPLRVKNRQTEIDGLLKAKAILAGASFATPADANREVKPGDALLQRARRH